MDFTKIYDVIIVGAGAAGLAAASTLKENHDVLVLEGRNRIGGRVWSDHSLGVSADLGASWIHGPIGNPITKIAEKKNLDLIPTNFDSIKLHDKDGNPLAKEKSTHIWDRFAKFLQKVTASRDSLESDVPLDNLFKSFDDSDDLKNLVTLALELEFAADSSDLSLFYFDSTSEFEGGNVMVSGGYRQILDELAKGLKILTGHTVEKIDHSSDIVIIHSKNSKFQAKHVIVTLPLGVLKNESVQFVPPLPQEKLQAIESLGMGTLDKVYLEFPEVFWDNDYEFVGYLPENNSPFLRFLNFYRITGKPILVGLVSGSEAELLEKLRDEDIVEKALEILKNIHGDIPNPTSYKITRWRSDPFSYGSYSFIPVGTAPDAFDTLASPVGDKLFFAGEATSKKYASTVHGAYLSGVREAKRIMSLQN